MSSLRSTTMHQGIALSAVLLLLFLTLPADVLASYSSHNILTRFGSSADHDESRPTRNLIAADPIEGVHAKHHKKKFAPGPWKHAHATFYEGSATTYGGACGYDDLNKEGYGTESAALSTALFNDGYGCGSCYEIKCENDPQWCKPGQPSIFVTGTDFCPPNYALPSNNGGWCNPPNYHFDLSKTAFLEIAEYKAGIVPVQYRRVPCKKQGGIRFTISGNPYYNKVLIWNVAGAGDIKMVKVKGSQNLSWTNMKRDWGQYWITDAKCVGESLTFRVIASDGRSSTSWHVTPENWQFGQTFEGKNFK